MEEDIVQTGTGGNGELSLCTRIANATVIGEALQKPQVFMSLLFHGKETFAEMAFNRGADFLKLPHICKEEFEVKVFRGPGDETICGVIKLPGAKCRADYSAIALNLCKNADASEVYTLEKADETTDFLRFIDRTGNSGLAEIVSNVGEEDKFQYVCDWLMTERQ